jgi:hypothetical protein
MFADFRPSGDGMVTLALPVDVGSVKTANASLTPDASLTQANGDLQVTLQYEGTLKAGQPTKIRFEVMDAQGSPVTGEIAMASGNRLALYAVDESLTAYLRPEVSNADTLEFSANFPTAGTYKVWFEYQYQNKPQQIAFVIAVP